MRAERWISWKPSFFSNALMGRESVYAGILSAAAARPKLPVLATSTNNAKSARKRMESPHSGFGALKGIQRTSSLSATAAY